MISQQTLLLLMLCSQQPVGSSESATLISYRAFECMRLSVM